MGRGSSVTELFWDKEHEKKEAQQNGLFHRTGPQGHCVERNTEQKEALNVTATAPTSDHSEPVSQQGRAGLDCAPRQLFQVNTVGRRGRKGEKKNN
ncbi:hypothetical protein AOLI_G00210150 [Acnodon oligacanthus]